MHRMCVRSAITAALGLLILACGDDSPTRPTPTPQTNTTPTPTLTSLELSGPDTVPPDGGTAQFNATARMSDGSSREVTNEATWGTSNGEVLSVTSPGLATGHQRGESGITAAYSGRNATRTPVLVLPEGTYRLSGVVTEAGLGVTGARVAVTLGTGQGQSTSTVNGIYRLYGVAGPVEIVVTKLGYEELKARPTVSGHQALDLALRLTDARTVVRGTYTLELTAAASCTSLPADVRTRRYAAVLTETGPKLVVTLSGATFVAGQHRTLNTFTGALNPSGMTFSIGGFYNNPQSFYSYLYDAEVAERLTFDTQFAVAGTVNASESGSVISGQLDGFMGVFSAFSRRIFSCYARNHQFVMAK